MSLAFPRRVQAAFPVDRSALRSFALVGLTWILIAMLAIGVAYGGPTVLLYIGVICAAGVLAVVAFNNPLIATLAIVFSLPFNTYSVSAPLIALTPSNGAIVIALLALAGHAARHDSALTPIAGVRPYLFLTGWLMVAEVASALASPQASAYAATVRPVITWIGFGSLLWILGVEARREERLPRMVAGALALSLACLAILTALVFLHVLPQPDAGNFGKVRSIGNIELPFGRALGSPITFGYFGMLVALALPLLLKGRRYADILPFGRSASIAIAVGVIGMAFVTVSRGVWLTTGAIAITYVLAGRLPALWRTGALPIIAVAALALSLPISPLSPALGSVAGGFVRIDKDTVNQRSATLEVAGDLFKRHPVLGVGTAYAEAATKARASTDAAVHNKFVGVLASLGLFGFIPFSLMWLRSLVSAWRISQRKEPVLHALGVAYFAATVGMIVQLQFFAGESLKVAAVLFVLIACSEAVRAPIAPAIEPTDD